MSYNGTGTFNINTAGQPVVTGTTITSTAFNLLTADLATGLTTALTKDGQTTPTANIPMGSFKITGLGAGTSATDAAQYGQLQAGATTIATVTGTDTLTGSVTPALAAYATGNLFSFVAASTNTGAATINLNSLGAKNITKQGTTALIAGDIASGRVHLIEYDGTRFQLLNPASSTGTGASVFATSPTLVTPTLGVATATSLQGIIGNVTPAAGAFTTVDASGAVTLSGGTANGVTYLNGSKVLTSGTGLQFDGTNLLVGTTSALASGSGRGNITVNGSTDAILAFGIGAATAGYIYQGASSLIINTQGAKPITFESNGVERGRFSATGALVLQGGDTTANGIGITFPATQSASSNANTLDDYEEGTFTPAITSASGSFGSVTYNTGNNLGYYTKVGRFVHVVGLVHVSSYTTGTASGAMRISLPFTNANSSQNAPPNPVMQYGGNGYTPSALTANVSARAEQGAAYFQLGVDNNVGYSDEAIGAFSTGGFLFRFNITYFV
jgi:hypothetical protein